MIVRVLIVTLSMGLLTCQRPVPSPQRAAVTEPCPEALALLSPLLGAADTTPRCQDIFGETYLEALRARVPQEERIDRFISAIAEARACGGAAGNVAGHARLLDALRVELASWYQSFSPATQAARALSEQRTAWADAYIEAEAELRARLHHDDARLGYDRRPHALLRVDALGAALLHALDAQGGARQRALLCWYGAALSQEARAWTAELSGNQQALPELQARIPVVTGYGSQLALAWRDESVAGTEQIRRHLGAPYASYVKEVLEHGGAGGANLQVQWGLPLITKTGGFTTLRRAALLKTIYDEVVLYDEKNLRASVEMLLAQEQWNGLLGQAQISADLARQQVGMAAQDLVRAYGHTLGRPTRLSAVARILDQSPLPLKPLASGSNVPAADVARRFLLRRLAELGLCLLNHAYLGDTGAACVLSPQDEPKPVVCAARDQAPLSGVPQVVKSAYERVLAALSVLGGEEGARLSLSTQCELAYLLSERHMVKDLGLDLRSFRQTVALLDGLDPAVKRSLKQQMGPVLSTAMQLAERKRQDFCQQREVTNCDFASVTSAGYGPSYCDEVITIGHNIYMVASGRAGQKDASLLAIARDWLQPLDFGQIDDTGGRFMSQYDQCEATATLPAREKITPPPPPPAPQSPAKNKITPATQQETRPLPPMGDGSVMDFGRRGSFVRIGGLIVKLENRVDPRRAATIPAAAVVGSTPKRYRLARGSEISAVKGMLDAHFKNAYVAYCDLGQEGRSQLGQTDIGSLHNGKCEPRTNDESLILILSPTQGGRNRNVRNRN